MRRETRINLSIPINLPSVEENFWNMAITLEVLSQPGLPKSTVKRLRKKMQIYTLYSRLFSKYVRYRKLELEIIKLARKYEELAIQSGLSKARKVL